MAAANLCTPDRFNRWLLDAPSGNVFEYHAGFLPRDRDINKTVDKLAVLAAGAYLAGAVSLTQQRRGDFQYAYLAEKR